MFTIRSSALRTLGVATLLSGFGLTHIQAQLLEWKFDEGTGEVAESSALPVPHR